MTTRPYNPKLFYVSVMIGLGHITNNLLQARIELATSAYLIHPK